MNDILYIGEAMKLLKYKQYSSFKRWCQRNKVKTFKEHGGKRKYVIYLLFNQARLKYVTEYLLSEYQCDWQRFMQCSGVQQMSDVSEITENKIGLLKAKSEKEKYYQSRLQLKIREL